MSWIKRFIHGLKQNWQGSAIMIGLWLLLGWLYTFGIRAAVLVPLNYFSAAIAGLDGGSFIGGTIGKTIVMVSLNGFFTTLILHKGNISEKWKVATSHAKEALLNTIPYFKNLKAFDLHNPRVIWLNVTGIGIGLISYAFLTGNGSFINSFVCLLLFFKIVSEVMEKRGIITALLNLILSLFGSKRISKKPVDYLMNGFALGTLLSLGYAIVFAELLPAYLLGSGFVCFGSIMNLVYIKKTEKELKECAN